MANKKIVTIFGLAFLILIPLAYNNCSQINFLKTQGVVAGNPFSASSLVLFSACSTLNRCSNQVPLEGCLSQAGQVTGVGQRLGVDADDSDDGGQSFDTFSNIQGAEASGFLTANLQETENCTSYIDNLSCTDPTVIGAYNPSTPLNPYSGIPGMLALQQCGRVFGSVDIQVPIELVDVGLSSGLAPIAFSRTRTSLNTTDYDGAVTYRFEITANNSDSSPRNVSLVDISGSIVATISIPSSSNSSSNPTLFSTPFSPTVGASDYRVQLDGTTSANQLSVYEGRIKVAQVGATQTKIYIPLTAGNGSQATSADGSGPLDTTASMVYSQPGVSWHNLWKKNNSAFSQIAAGSPWVFEAVLSASGGTAYASVFDSNSGLQVSASEVSTNSSNPILVSAAFADASPNFSDLDTMTVEIKEAGGTANLYRAGLWLTLTNLSHGEVYFRYLNSAPVAVGPANDVTTNRLFFNASAFGAYSAYNQVVSSAATGTNCTMALFDNGLNDVGVTGSQVPGSTLSASSAAPSLQRSGPFNLFSWHRYSASVSNAGPGTCNQTGFLIIVF